MNTEAKDAATYRELQREMGELIEGGQAANTTSLCAMYLAARAHKINAGKAEFKLGGLSLEDGTPIGDWKVTIKRIAA
jgi:hypothetical protein